MAAAPRVSRRRPPAPRDSITPTFRPFEEPPRSTTVVLTLALILLQAPPPAAPQVTEGDFVIRNFRFTSGETLPELRMHYRTLGTPRRNAQGVVENAVLIMHGTGGTGGQFTGRNFAGELFGPGQPLDAARFYIILPDDIGHGGSSKPSHGLRAKFPRYGYVDMVEAEYRLVSAAGGTRVGEIAWSADGLRIAYEWLAEEDAPASAPSSEGFYVIDAAGGRPLLVQESVR